MERRCDELGFLEKLFQEKGGWDGATAKSVESCDGTAMMPKHGHATERNVLCFLQRA